MASGSFNLRKFLCPEFIIGTGAMNLAGNFALNLEAKKVLIVTDKGIIKAGWVEKLIKQLKRCKLQFSVFDNITPNPKDYEVMEGAYYFVKERCDVIVAIGGGSPMDCAKGISIVCTNNKHILEFEGVDKIETPGIPLICIPSTAGTGADVSQFAIINDTKRKIKIAIVSKKAVPDIALIDPLVTKTMGRELTAATGMDALCHAFESYVSNASSEMTDLHALKAISLIWKYLPLAYKTPNRTEYRDKMMLASLFAGIAFSNASLGLVHSMAHSLGGYLDLPHGECNAVLLEKVVDYNFNSAVNRYKNICNILQIDVGKNDTRELLVNKLKEFRAGIGIDYSLGSIGLKKKDIPRLASNAIKDPCLITNPKKATLKDIIKCYEKAL
jgi:alcohol dehydrogenase class IV